MKADGQTISNLTRSAMFRNYERAFVEATGMPLTLRAIQDAIDPSYLRDYLKITAK